MRIFYLLILFIMTLAGCDGNQNSNNNIDEPVEKYKEELLHSSETTAEDYLSKHDNADIIQFNGVIYRNIQNTGYDNGLIIGDYLGEIVKQTTNSEEFQNGVASSLPVGTKLYFAEGDYTENIKIILADVNGEKIPYLYRIEG